jgi:hypothetical protein
VYRKKGQKGADLFAGEGSPPENVQLIDLPKVVVTGSERHFVF